MVMKVFLGSLHKHNVSSARTLNTWGSFSHRSYCIAQKIENLSSTNLTELECEIHNSKIPTYEEVNNSPELQAELEKMYEEYATDPDFHKLTIESMKIGLRSFGKEKC